MIMTWRYFGTLFVLVVLFGSVSIRPVHAVERSELVHRIDRSETFVQKLMLTRDTAIPISVWRNARGILVFRQYKIGFIFGIKGGYGIAMVRDEETREWSPPAFYQTGEGSVGFQIGGEAVNSVFLLMEKQALDMLIKSEFKLGGDVSVAGGPVGRQAEYKIGQSAPILAYSQAEGLYAGVSIEGGVLLPDNDANRVFYGIKDLKSRQILFENRVEMPEEARSLVKRLNFYSNPDLPEP